MPAMAYLNGRFLPIEDAVVSVEDRGFQLGDGVYEVLRTYGGEPFAMAAHLRRLFRSLEAVEIQHSLTPAGLEGIVREGLERAGFSESLVYLQITRGAAKRAKAFPPGLPPTLVLTIRELEPLSPELRADGVRIMTAKDFRWQRCDIKSLGLLANVLTFNRAKDAGFREALFVEEDGTAAECTSANIFIVQGGSVVTPPQSTQILGGITREEVIALARHHRLPLAERRITLPELLAAEEVFLTGTTVEILPVIQVDDHRIGEGKPGPVSGKLYTLFQSWVKGG